MSNTDLIDLTHLITKAILITRLSTPKCKCFSRKSVIKIKIQKPARRLEATECCCAYGALHAVRIVIFSIFANPFSGLLNFYCFQTLCNGILLNQLWPFMYNFRIFWTFSVLPTMQGPHKVCKLCGGHNLSPWLG